jgi:adenylate kinase
VSKAVVLLGPPASGKGTQAARFSAKHGFLHFDMGAALRSEIESGSALASEIKSFTNVGKLVPTSIVRDLVLSAIQTNPEADFVFDGFPRSMEQAHMLDGVLAVTGRKLTGAVLIDVPEEVIVQRIVNRRFCPECGRVYNLVTLPPREGERCDDDGVALEQRRDDTQEVLAERLRVYHGQTEPIIEHYRKAGLLKRIDGTQAVDDISREMESAVFGDSSNG